MSRSVDPYGPFRRGYKGTIALADWEAEEVRIRRNQELVRVALALANLKAELAQRFFDGLFGDTPPDGPAGRALFEELRQCQTNRDNGRKGG